MYMVLPNNNSFYIKLVIVQQQYAIFAYKLKPYVGMCLIFLLNQLSDHLQVKLV